MALSVTLVYAALLPMWTRTFQWDQRVYELRVIDVYGGEMPSEEFFSIESIGASQWICILYNSGSVALDLSISDNVANLGSATVRFDVDTVPPRVSPYSYPAWDIAWSSLMLPSAVHVVLPPGYYWAIAAHIDVPAGEIGSYSFAIVRTDV